ncbi:39S ribosomal protein L50, mitochondrial [Contarinia nasturtii]|uniref:39S ribosomal protein L50, mitochondrial n=1 Tax=Contarinia nasturtii TaxID=265458 RepID=UPI0012D46A05|nr:39S ribosomal protein L50, mitochondrial [Contarinia nasturtii]
MMLNVTRQIFGINHLNKPNLCALTQIRCAYVRGNRDYIKRPKPIPHIKFEASAQSLKAKGYLRPQDPYTPPKNVPQIVDQLKTNAKLKTGFGGKKFSIDDKFNFLLICAEEFNRTVPNSVLHEMETLNDVIDFYETPVNTILPLDELTTRELPPNLHIEQKYTRFNPETDKMFNGKTAFPQSSTIITGIKYRKKYPGFVAEKKLGIDEDP